MCIQRIQCISGFVKRTGILCIQVINVKKTEIITYRTDGEIKDLLAQIAAEKKWSISQLSEEIIKEWLREKRPDLMKSYDG